MKLSTIVAENLQAGHPDETLIVAAIRHFGITTHPHEVGYLLPGGEMLDLSGRHHSSDFRREGMKNTLRRPGPDWLSGQRLVDHRELGELVEGGGTDGMIEFMRRTNAIRVMPKAGFMLARRPSERQIKIMALLGSFYVRAGDTDAIYVEACDPTTGIVDHTTTIERPSVEAIRTFLQGV